MAFILILALIFAIFEWYFEYKKNKLGIYLTKPTVILLLIAWIWSYSDVSRLLTDENQSGVIWFIFGLLFCLGGDIFLLLPERFFLPGLISFLVGHICYIIGFGVPIPPPGFEIASIAITAILVFVSGWIYTRLVKGMQALGKNRMRIPVLFYTVVISLMLLSAVMTLFSDEWDLLSATIVSVGAFLFLLSDIMNAWVRFVAEIQNHRLWIMSSYHIAQICISVGAGLHFSAFAPLT